MVLNGDGTQFSFTGTGYVCTAIEDRNGNLINVSYNGNLPVSVTDSLGRVIAFNYMNGFLSSITQNWGGQTHTWATVNYNSVFFNYNFPGLQVNAPQNQSLLAVPTQVNFMAATLCSRIMTATACAWRRLRMASRLTICVLPS